MLGDVEIKIGVTHIARELGFETDLPADQVQQRVHEAVQNNGVLELEGQNGRKLIVPASKIGYVELGAEQQRQVGFGV